jgi:hypothetical protein
VYWGPRLVPDREALGERPMGRDVTGTKGIPGGARLVPEGCYAAIAFFGLRRAMSAVSAA